MGIYQKIAKARVDLSALKLTKTGTNKFAGYDYFELSDILPSCLRICNEVGITPIISFEGEYATMTVYDCESGESIQLKSPLAEATLKGCHPIQNIGAIETYSRRYLWFSLFEISEPDQLDSTTKEDKPAQSEPKRNATAVARPTKTNQNDSKVLGEPDYTARTVWSRIMSHFGYVINAPESMESVKAKEKSLEFIKPYGCKTGKDITPEIGKAIIERLDNMEIIAE